MNIVKNRYKVTNDNGQPLSGNLQNQMRLPSTASDTSLIDNWETMPIAVQMISPQNDLYNIFNVYPD